MRHNQNGRRFRGRGNNGHGGHGGHGHGGQGGGGNHNNQRRVNPRVQIFDSNGPDVRVRGNAYQINEKYLALARDATAAGDRVLAESYFQHAEHYQRFINEMTEEYNKYQQQTYGADAEIIPTGPVASEGSAEVAALSSEQPKVPMNDLDQAFLVGRKPDGTAQPAADGSAEQEVQQQPHQGGRMQHRAAGGRGTHRSHQKEGGETA